MKRIHLFEFEDFNWFPNFLRICLTRYINTMHKLLGTKDNLNNLLEKALAHSSEKQIIDLCSGSGGPMIDALKHLKQKPGLENLKLILTDLYPNLKAAKKINEQNNSSLTYNIESINATKLNSSTKGLRTMICSMHHMKPEVAKEILKDAKENKQPICIYEISDNGFPKWLWWTAFPINIITTFFITPMIRPMSWQQLIFTYIVPILPIIIAWDGAVSNARTYTLADMDILLEGLKSDDYIWKKNTIKGKGGNKIYLMGLPV
jgi:hypothetical protein